MHYIKYLHYFQSFQLSNFWYLHFSWLKAYSDSTVHLKKACLNFPWAFRLAHSSGKNLSSIYTIKKCVRQLGEKSKKIYILF